FDNIEIIECVGRGEFSSGYKRYWIDGPRWVWNENEDFWRLSGPQNLKYIGFGITRDETGRFMFVMRYYENGNLYEYIDNNKGVIGWRDMTDLLWEIADESVSTDAKMQTLDFMAPADKSVPQDVIIDVLPFIDPQHMISNLLMKICKNLRPEISEELKSEMPEEYHN
ncbi:26024_t:CDS:2, partial [Gigaspora rosea]